MTEAQYDAGGSWSSYHHAQSFTNALVSFRLANTLSFCAGGRGGLITVTALSAFIRRSLPIKKNGAQRRHAVKCPVFLQSLNGAQLSYCFHILKLTLNLQMEILLDNRWICCSDKRLKFLVK